MAGQFFAGSDNSSPAPFEGARDGATPSPAANLSSVILMEEDFNKAQTPQLMVAADVNRL